MFHQQLIKPPNGYLGLVLVGGTDTPLQKHYIKDILPNSIASRDGRVKIGDELIEVNGHSLRGRTHSLALAVIHSLPPVIRLVIERSKDANKSILSRCLFHGDFQENSKPDPHITSPKDRSNKSRSVLELANETSVINKSVNTVINIQRTGFSASIKPVNLVRRESRCSSFIIGDDDSDDDDEDDDVIAFECDDVKSVKEGVISEETGSDCDDRLSMLSNTSEWCAKQVIHNEQMFAFTKYFTGNSFVVTSRHVTSRFNNQHCFVRNSSQNSGCLVYWTSFHIFVVKRPQRIF